MCLESRDPAVPTIAQRLPIDLASFTNIDARQMNRNISYLTGLVEPVEETAVLDPNRKPRMRPGRPRTMFLVRSR